MKLCLCDLSYFLLAALFSLSLFTFLRFSGVAEGESSSLISRFWFPTAVEGEIHRLSNGKNCDDPRDLY